MKREESAEYEKKRKRNGIKLRTHGANLVKRK